MNRSSADAPTRIHPCPVCRKPVAWNASSPQRPFCSRRCQLVDLGTWASDGYQIPAEPSSALEQAPLEDEEQP